MPSRLSDREAVSHDTGPTRRGFLGFAVAGGLAGTEAAVVGRGGDRPVESAGGGDVATYRLTEHVRRYYELAGW